MSKIEQKFYTTFGIKKEYYVRHSLDDEDERGRWCVNLKVAKARAEYDSGVVIQEYPEITDSILLKLILEYNNFDSYDGIHIEHCLDSEDVKNVVLSKCIALKSNLEEENAITFYYDIKGILGQLNNN